MSRSAPTKSPSLHKAWVHAVVTMALQSMAHSESPPLPPLAEPPMPPMPPALLVLLVLELFVPSSSFVEGASAGQPARGRRRQGSPLQRKTIEYCASYACCISHFRPFSVRFQTTLTAGS